MSRSRGALLQSGLRAALAGARELVYIEDRDVWSVEIASLLAQSLRREPGLCVVAVLPLGVDRGPRGATTTEVLRCQPLLELELESAGPGRVGVYGVEQTPGAPTYVPPRVCVVDDHWVSIGAHDAPTRWAPGLRDELVREHLALPDDAPVPIGSMFAQLACAAKALDVWSRGGRGPRPAGRLRGLHVPSAGPTVIPSD